MSFFTNNKTGERYFVIGYGVDHTNPRAGLAVVAYYPCSNPAEMCFRELTEFKEKFTPVQSDQPHSVELKDLPYPLRLCVETMLYAGLSSDVAKEMRPSEVIEQLGNFFTEDCINEARKIVTGRSEFFKG